MAAAYAALVSLFNNLELIQTHPRHSFSFDNKQIQSLLQIVCFLIDFMETGDYHGSSKEAAEFLERQIACATHAAEDVIESHVVDQIHAGSTLDGKRRSRFLLDVQKVTEDMEFVRRKAIQVQDARSGFKADRPTFSATTSSTPLTSSDKDKMVGFDDALLQLLGLLTGNPSSRQVIPVVGTGGIGKTTLAKNAFQHPLTVEHFNVCLWVTISLQYDVTDILLTLLSRHGEPNTKNVGELGKELYQKLYGRKYLIVLDDMWSVEAWDETKFFFPDTSCGSRIIVTSRQSDVAKLGSLSLAMSFLKKDESWDLFCQKAFAEQSCPLELKEAGKKIVKKCGGLPLAIVVVGGHLRMSPRTQEYWENVANHMNSTLNSGENDEQLFDILNLSYSYLPVHLKPCFVYMGVFPEDRVISVSFLTRLWIAEGFLKPKDDQTLEEVAEGCLQDLISRNLILGDQLSSKWKTISCGIHDVLRELCLRIAEKEKLFCVLDTSRSIHGERRVVINDSNAEEIQHVLRSAPHLRSQIIWKGCHVSINSKLLRVAINKDEKAEAPDEDFWAYESVNLRFLEYGIKNKRSFVYTTEEKRYNMDSSISALWNLQTLIVRGGHRLTMAPCEIWEMTQLRHLQCEKVYLPDPLPSDEATDMVLQNLQKLKKVVNLRLSDEVCKSITNIKDLRMCYLIKKCDEAWSYCPHNLGRLHKLQSLDFRMYSKGPEWHKFAQALTFPSLLKKLSLSYVHLDWEDISMKIGSLTHLEVLKLCDVKGGAEWHPVEKKFPSLRYLDICGCRDLANWNAERSHFPVLEYLSLIDAKKLDELPCGIGEIPTLQRIDIVNCSVSLGISALGVVVEQEENGNDSLHLHLEFLNKKEYESFDEIVQEKSLISNNLHFSRNGW